MSINKRIREVLRSKDVTHEQVAELLNLNRASVSHQLRAADTDSIKLLVAVKKLTNARYEWLISGELPPKGDDVKFKDFVEARIQSANADMEARIQSANADMEARIEAHNTELEKKRNTADTKMIRYIKRMEELTKKLPEEQDYPPNPTQDPQSREDVKKAEKNLEDSLSQNPMFQKKGQTKDK